MNQHSETAISRRELLRQGALGATSLALLASAAEASPAEDPYAPFKMGLQSYSLRNFKTEEALKMTQDLGLRYWEAYPGHFPLTEDPKAIRQYKEMLRAYKVKLLTYGVVEFRNNEAEARHAFNFAKAMGIQNLSAYPMADSFPLLDKLVAEYKINIAIHNHGPGDKLYDLISKGVRAIGGHHFRIGSCNDTGHYLRSNEDPVEAAKQFGKRTYGVHLKDVKDGANGAKEFTEINKGNLKTTELLKVLVANKFGGMISLEYEEHPEAPTPYITECLAETKKSIAAM